MSRLEQQRRIRECILELERVRKSIPANGDRGQEIAEKALTDAIAHAYLAWDKI